MTTTIERNRPKIRRKPILREVCLIGDRTRRYDHLVPEGLRTQDSKKDSELRMQH